MTSIEWLAEMVSKIGYVSADIVEQAKEMHKVEILDAFNNADAVDENNIGWGSAEKYYQETFKKELTSQLPGVNVNDVKPSNPQMVKDIF
jgi:hypothetical protein